MRLYLSVVILTVLAAQIPKALNPISPKLIAWPRGQCGLAQEACLTLQKNECPDWVGIKRRPGIRFGPSTVAMRCSDNRFRSNTIGVVLHMNDTTRRIGRQCGSAQEALTWLLKNECPTKRRMTGHPLSFAKGCAAPSQPFLKQHDWGHVLQMNGNARRTGSQCDAL